MHVSRPVWYVSAREIENLLRAFAKQVIKDAKMLKTEHQLRMIRLYGKEFQDLPEPYVKRLLSLPCGQSTPALERVKKAWRDRLRKPLVWEGVVREAEGTLDGTLAE